MKIGIAMMSHETNTFSPVITDLERFSGGHGQPLEGQTALQTYRGTASCLGGYIEVAEAQQVDIEMGIAAGAPPSCKRATAFIAFPAFFTSGAGGSSNTAFFLSPPLALTSVCERTTSTSGA